MSTFPELQENLLMLRRVCLALDAARGSPPSHGPRQGPTVLERFRYQGRLYTVSVRVAPPRARSLSQRELEVLTLIGRGHTNKEIAFELGVAWSTIRVFVHRIGRKLGVRRRADIQERMQADRSVA